MTLPVHFHSDVGASSAVLAGAYVSALGPVGVQDPTAVCLLLQIGIPGRGEA